MSYLLRLTQLDDPVELTREELVYYTRHLLLPGIGVAGQCKLKAARVLVVGAGGLGCPVLQALAGAGVGRLTVIDADSVALSNLSRQWLHRHRDVGTNKALSAQRTLRALNPFIEIQAEPTMLSQDNAAALVEAHDLVVDATDDLGVRYVIDDACADADNPWVHAALYRDRAQLSVFWARYGARFRGLYPEPGEAPSCSGAGMLGATASVVGHLQALEAIKLIVGNAAPQLGKLVSFDAVGLALQSFQLPGVTMPPRYEDIAPKESGLGLSVEALRQALSIHEPIELLDVRDRSQFAAGSIDGARHRPAEAILESGLPENGAARFILYCQEGSISQILTDALKGCAKGQIQHLEGGYQAWTAFV